MHLHPVFYITLPCFLIGAACIALINKRRGKSAKKENEARWLKYWVYLILVHVVIVAIIQGGTYFLYLMALITAIGAVELLYQGITNSERSVFSIFFSIVLYLTVVYGFYLFAGMATKYILFVYVVVLCFDGFSQLCGQLMGKNKLVPQISPAKTVEGLVGGIVLTVAVSFIIGHWAGLSITESGIFAQALCLAALFGDLLASYYKRILNIKDYSKIIPGHGGVLDRFDGFLMAGAAFYIFQ